MQILQHDILTVSSYNHFSFHHEIFYSFVTKPTLTRRDKKMFEAQAKYVREQVMPKKETLYKEYLTDSVGEI